MGSSSSFVVLQTICTIWTKASRGGANATARNKTPDAFVLPALTFPVPEETFLLHKVVYTEHNGFQGPRETFEPCERTNPFWYNCLHLEVHHDALRVMLEWERSEGVPRRPSFPRIVWSLQQGQWGRLAYNLRKAESDHWVYKKYVISVCLLHSYSPSIFLEGKPTSTYSDMAQLR